MHCAYCEHRVVVDKEYKQELAFFVNRIYIQHNLQFSFRCERSKLDSLTVLVRVCGQSCKLRHSRPCPNIRIIKTKHPFYYSGLGEEARSWNTDGAVYYSYRNSIITIILNSNLNIYEFCKS